MSEDKPQYELKDEQLLQYINRQTARIQWSELERAFAQGLLVAVAPGHDLVQVAFEVINNQSDKVERYLDENILIRVSGEEAKLWSDSNQTFWAVVTAPWVLIQVTDPK